MTGFARTEGGDAGLSWVWELRSVNGRGLDLRFRLPPGWDALEPALREAVGKALKRGNVTASLTIKREQETKLILDSAGLEQALSLVLDLQSRIPGSPPPRPEALLGLPGVMRMATIDPSEKRASAGALVQEGFARALAALIESRAAEGARIATVMQDLLREIATLRETAEEQAADQPARQRARMMENLAGLLREASSLPEDRLVQEVALLAARSDVREELDRLASHVTAAHALLQESKHIGRKLDFLIQEFNREANTLCSKSASAALTATGLKLKAAIEQFREQAQNVE